MAPLLAVDGLSVAYDTPRGTIRPVDGVSFRVESGETYALVGESGCGKSTIALAIMRLVEPGRIAGGSIRLDGLDLLGLSEAAMCAVRGGRIGLVFQEAGSALNPVMRVGTHVGEALRVHRGLSRREALREAEHLLGLVALPDPKRQARAWPHELSGGMKQRVMIAIALACSPALLIADEPTSSLDVTVQAQVLALIRDLKQRFGLTVLLITHDLAVVAENADRIGVMHHGRIVEEGAPSEIFETPRHPYTLGLLAALHDETRARGTR